MSDPSAVTLAYVHDVEVTHSFHDSLVNLLMLDVANEQRVIRGGYIKMRCGSGGLVEARNKVAEAFLAQNADWLFLIDTDMGFAPDSLERLMAAAHPVDRPIVGGLCFAWRELHMDDMSGFRCAPRPTIFDWVRTPEGDKFMGVTQYPADSVVQCAGTGAACVLIHRSVIEKIQQAHGSTWYDRVKGTDGSLLGEDISFCVRATACGFPIHVHTGVKTTHMKHLWVSEADYLDAMALQTLASPASEPGDRPVVAVIPTRWADSGDGTPYATRLVEQLRAQGEATDIIVVDNDPVEAPAFPKEWNVTELDGTGMGIHEMWNLGIDRALARYGDRAVVALLNDDLRIGDKFLSSLVQALDSDPNLAAVSANYDGRGAAVPVVEVNDICAGRYDGTGGLAGFAFAVDGTYLASGYRFPVKCKWWYGDNDLMLSLRSAGLRAGIVIAATVEHLNGGGQTGGDWSAYADQLDADRQAFERRWSLTPSR